LGVASFFFSKAVLPIGLLALLGVGLFAFRSQIVGAISGGATTLGQAITTPFGSFLSGIQQGLGTIPESIDFRLPSFNFIFGQSDPSNDPIGQLQTDFDNFIKNSQEFFDLIAFNPFFFLPLFILAKNFALALPVNLAKC